MLSVTSFTDYDDAIRIANDTLYGLGGGGLVPVGRHGIPGAGRAIQAGRVWTNTYHQYPAYAAFGGYKLSGIGRENHLEDAGPLPADEEPARVLRRGTDGLLLIDARGGRAEKVRPPFGHVRPGNRAGCRASNFARARLASPGEERGLGARRKRGSATMSETTTYERVAVSARPSCCAP